MAKAIVDEFWRRLKEEVGNSVIKKILWGLVLLAVYVAYLKFPWPSK